MKILLLYSEVEDSGHRILPENIGIPWNWKQYSGWKLSRFFPVDSCQLPVCFDRNRLKIIEKSPKNFRPEYCFHVLGNSSVFRPEPTRTY
jgi:hypothetical protein